MKKIQDGRFGFRYTRRPSGRIDIEGVGPGYLVGILLLACFSLLRSAYGLGIQDLMNHWKP